MEAVVCVDILTCVSFPQTLPLFLFYANTSTNARTIAAKTVTCCCSPPAVNFVSLGREVLGSHTFPSITDILDQANNMFVASLVLCHVPPMVLEVAAGAGVG